MRPTAGPVFVLAVVAFGALRISWTESQVEASNKRIDLLHGELTTLTNRLGTLTRTVESLSPSFSAKIPECARPRAATSAARASIGVGRGRCWIAK